MSLLPSFGTGKAHAGTALPWGIVTRVHNMPAHASGGTRIDTTLIQMSVYAASVLEAETIADRIKAIFVPTVSLPIVGGTVLGFYLANDQGGVPVPRAATGKETYTFVVHMTFRVLVSRPN